MPEKTTLSALERRTRRSLELGRIAHLKMQRVTEMQVLSMYQDTAGKIANMIISIEDDFIQPYVLRNITSTMGTKMKQLHRKTFNLLEKRLSSMVKDTIDLDIASMSIWDGYLTRGAHAGMTVSAKAGLTKSTVRALLTPIDAITLSDRIWDINRATLDRMKRSIAQGFLMGKSKNVIGQELRKLLLIPEADLRKKIWKQFFKENPPGRGVYKSAYKNVQRVIRTETNRAFRLSQAAYADKKTWIVAVRWHRVSGAIECPECDEYANQDYYGLGSGVFPPDAVPLSHPQCVCFLTNEVSPKYINRDLVTGLAA